MRRLEAEHDFGTLEEPSGIGAWVRITGYVVWQVLTGGEQQTWHETPQGPFWVARRGALARLQELVDNDGSLANLHCDLQQSALEVTFASPIRISMDNQLVAELALGPEDVMSLRTLG